MFAPVAHSKFVIAQLLVLSACTSAATGGTLSDAGLPPGTPTALSPYALLGTGNGDPWGVAWMRFLSAIVPATLPRGPSGTLPKVVCPLRQYRKYVSRLAHVSPVCRLSPDEERAIQAVCATLVARMDGYASISSADDGSVDARSVWLAAESTHTPVKLASRRPPNSLLGHGLLCAIPLIEEAMKFSGGAQPRELVEARKQREIFHAIPAPPPECGILADAYSVDAAVAAGGLRLRSEKTATVIRGAMGEDLKRTLSDCRAERIVTISDDAALLVAQLTCAVPPLDVLRHVSGVALALPTGDAARTLGVLLARDWLHRATCTDVGQPARLSARPVLGVVAALAWAVSVQLSAKWDAAGDMARPAAPTVIGDIVAPAVGDYDAASLCSHGVARCYGPFQRTDFAGGSKRQRELHEIKLRLQTPERVAESTAVEAYHGSLLRALARCGTQALNDISAARRERTPAAELTEIVPAPPCDADSVTVTLAVLLLEPSRGRERAAARDTACASRDLVGVSSEDAAALRQPLQIAVDIFASLVAGGAAAGAAAAVGVRPADSAHAAAASGPEPHTVLASALGKHASAGTEAGRGLSERVQNAARAIAAGDCAPSASNSVAQQLSPVALAAAVDAARARALRNRTNVTMELMGPSGPLELLAFLESGLDEARRTAGNAAEICRAVVLTNPAGPARVPPDARMSNADAAAHAAALALLQHVSAEDRVDMMRALARTMRSAARA